MSFNFNDWYNQISQGNNNPNMDYGGPANNYDYYGLNQGQGQGQDQGQSGIYQPAQFAQVNPTQGGMNDLLNPSNQNIGADVWQGMRPQSTAGQLGNPTNGYGSMDLNGQTTQLYPVDNGSGKVRDPQTGQMVDPYTGQAASTGPDLFNNPGLPKLDANSKIPNATDNYGPGMIDAMNKSAAANAGAQLTPNLPGGTGGMNTPRYNNLYGSDIAGSQLGFNELNGKQFTDNSDAFKSVFGSTQGTGAGNNYNWNVYPQFSADHLDPQAQAQIIQIAQANPQYDFEPTMINGKWVLASRARDISQQKSLLAPVLPPTNPVGGGAAGAGGGGARAGGSGGYGSTGYGSGSTGYGGGGAGGSGSGAGGPTAQQRSAAQGTISKGILQAEGALRGAANYERTQPTQAQQQAAIGKALGGVVGNIFSNPVVQNVATPISPDLPPTPLLPPAGMTSADGKYYWTGSEWVLRNAPANPRGGNPTFYGDNYAG